jgi:hypothetical protein
MNVKPNNGLTHIQYRALIRRHIEHSNGLAAELGITDDDLWIEFADYAMISVRVIPDEKAHQKVFAQGVDNAETIQKKFKQYLDLERGLIQSWRDAIIASDEPQDAVLAPNAQPDDEKND